MKVDGNSSATDFFTQHSSSSLLNNSNIKRKYMSQVAKLYKEELACPIKEDIALWALFYL
jgi:ADP-ribosylation factor GTPase-activating protein 2/3